MVVPLGKFLAQVSWGPQNCFSHPKSYFLCDLKPYVKLQNPRTTPSGRKKYPSREKIMLLIVDS